MSSSDPSLEALYGKLAERWELPNGGEGGRLDGQVEELRDYQRVRWPDPLTLIALRAARMAFGQPPGVLGPVAERRRATDLILCTHAAGNQSRSQFVSELESKRGRLANPTRYVSGLYNVPAATLMAELELTGRSLTICPWSRGEQEAFEIAMEWLPDDRSERVLVGCLHSGGASTGHQSIGFSCLFLLESQDSSHSGPALPTPALATLEDLKQQRTPLGGEGEVDCLGLAFLRRSLRAERADSHTASKETLNTSYMS